MEFSKADQKALDSFDALEKEIAAKPAPGDLKSLCEIYRSVRPIIVDLLPWIRRIPIVGEKIANILEFLMKLADLACGTR